LAVAAANMLCSKQYIGEQYIGLISNTFYVHWPLLIIEPGTLMLFLMITTMLKLCDAVRFNMTTTRCFQIHCGYICWTTGFHNTQWICAKINGST